MKLLLFIFAIIFFFVIIIKEDRDMKKNNLLKIIMVTFFAVIFLSWIIPVGEYNNAAFISGNITPVGLFDLTLIPLTVFDLALPSIIFILVVGGLYGIINKTGVYNKMISDLTSKLKGKELKFLIIVAITFVILSSLVGLNLAFFFILPFIVAILLSLGFSKITTMLATIGSIIIGMMGSIYGTDISYYLNRYLSHNSDYTYNTSIFPDRIILLILLIFLLVMFILHKGKNDLKNSKSKNEEIPLYEKNDSSKKSWKPLFIILITSFVLIVLGSFKWDDVLGTNANPTPFLNFYEKIMGVEINGFPIVSSILGTIPAIGYWKLPFISVFTLFITILFAIIYKVKGEDILAGFQAGIKANFKLILYIIGSNLVLAILFKNGATANFATTIVDYLMNIPDKFNTLILSFTTIISSFFYNNFSVLVDTLYTPTVILTGTTVELRFLASIIIQTMYGLVMFIAPTSVLLITGLAYFDISYKEWFKNIWKLLLQLFIVIVLLLIIVTIFSM